MWILFGGFTKGKKETSVFLHEDAFLEALCVCLSVQARGAVLKERGDCVRELTFLES